MAISPTVQAYQQQQMNQEGASSDQISFNKKFGEQAFRILNSKYPDVLKNVITFKVVESDVDQGSATGAFVLAKGKDVIYIPVVLNDGSIESCEMLYDKAEDTISPLIPQEVKRITSSNKLQGPSVAGKAPYVENTESIFRGMFRPPASSNPVLAGSSVAAAFAHVIPNEAKKALVTYFEKNSHTLLKVADFYPVEALGAKLAETAQDTADSLAAPKSPEIIRLGSLTKEASAALNEQDRQEVLSKGYTVRIAEDVDYPNNKVASTQNLACDVVTQLNLTEIAINAEVYGTAKLISIKGSDSSLRMTPCIIAGGLVVTQDGSFTRVGCMSRSLIVADYEDGIERSDILRFGAIDVDTAAQQYRSTSDKVEENVEKVENSQSNEGSSEIEIPGMHAHFTFWYPTKANQWKLLRCKDVKENNGSERSPYVVKYELPYSISPYYMEIRSATFENIEGSTFVKNKAYPDMQDTVGYVPYIKSGFVRIQAHDIVLPKEAYIMVSEKDNNSYLTSLSALHRIMRLSGERLVLNQVGTNDMTLRNTTTDKVAHFNDEASLVTHVVHQYGLSKEAVDMLIKKQDVLLFKEAFLQPSSVEGPGASIFDNKSQQPQPQPQPQFQRKPQVPAQQMEEGGGEEPNYNVNGELVDASAELSDEDIMDTGMLASLAGDDDIKSLLVDMNPQFSETVTNLGKSILVFTMNNKTIEDYYGRESYSTLLSNMRKVFRMLGEIVYDLRLYTNMK